MASIQGVKLMRDGNMVFPITHINAVKNESGQNLSTVLGGKANSSHTHDDRYYTEAEIDSKVSSLNSAISGKASSSHSHIAYSTSVTKDSGSRFTLPSCTTAGEIRLVRVSNLGMGDFSGYISLYAPSGGTYMVLEWGYRTDQGGAYDYRQRYDCYFSGNAKIDDIGIEEGEYITSFYCLYAKIS